MTPEQLDFITRSTLLFIASRNAEGQLDVSPRGGQPRVVGLSAAGDILLPDYRGNRRLDTVGNILARPDVALLFVNHEEDRYLRVSARASFSRAPEHMIAFPADENPPIGVLVLTPTAATMVETTAFDASGFWIDPDARKQPLDVLALVREDTGAVAEAGKGPILKNNSEEDLLLSSGMRDVYGFPSQLVREKVADFAGPGAMTFLRDAGLIALAREDEAGEIVMDLVGEAPLQPVPGSNSIAYRLALPSGFSTLDTGEIALLTLAPGRHELVRMNGRYERAPEPATASDSLRIRPEEVFFHCSAAMGRARIWNDDERTYWSGQRRFVCTRRIDEAPGVVSFVVEPQDAAPVGTVKPGQYISVSLPTDPTPLPRRRSYSVSGRPDDRALRFTVRRIGKGGVSDLLHDSLQLGDDVSIGPPNGHFVLQSPAGRPVVLISAGVGITPLLPMLETLAAESGARDVWFVHGAANSGHHLFAAEVARISAGAKGPRIRPFTAYSRPHEDDHADHTGRIDAGVIAGLVPPADADFYICGPGDFMTGLRDGLVARGAAPDSVRFEAFESADPTALFAAKGPASAAVRFAKTGKEAIWTPESGTLLDLALVNGVDVSYSCRMGDCQSCLQRVLEGGVTHPALEGPQPGRGQALLCQAIPSGDVTLQC